MNINRNTGFVTIGRLRKKTFVIVKNRRRIVPKWNILKSNNMGGTFN